MEVVGAASAIVSLIEIALKTASYTYETFIALKDARDTQFRITREMRDLTRVLEQLLAVVSSKNVQNGTKHTTQQHAEVLIELFSEESNSVKNCEAAVGEVLRLLQGRKISWPLRKKQVDSKLDMIGRFKTQLSLALQTQSMATILSVEQLLISHNSKLAQHFQESADNAIVTWLQAPDIWHNLRNALQRRQPRTGDWFINSAAFQAWSFTPQFLWLTGMPGAGKTIISSTIITHLLRSERNNGATIVYSYFDFQNETQRKPEALLSTILAQLVVKDSRAMDCLRQLYNSYKDRGAPSNPSPEELLQALLEALSYFPKTYLVVDALDECEDRKQLITYIKAIFESSRVHLLVLSRRERDIQLHLQAFAKEYPLEGAQMDADIALYIQERINASEDMAEWDIEDREKVRERLEEKAHGMFRWVDCQLNSLEQCIDAAQIEETLDSLPKDLPATYERILGNLDQKNVKSVHSVLTSLAFARRSLSKAEVSNILQIQLTKKPYVKSSKVFWNRLLTACSSLITIFSSSSTSSRDGSQEIRLAHFSVKEYLMSEIIRESEMKAFYLSNRVGNRFLAETCLACLLHHDNAENFGPQALEDYPFTLYAAMNWPGHAKELNFESDFGLLDNLIFEFFHLSNEAYTNWHLICGSTGPDSAVDNYAWNLRKPTGQVLTYHQLLNRHYMWRPLVHATRWNFHRIVRRLLEAGHKPNDLVSGNHTAMHYGAETGALESMGLLVGLGRGNINCGSWVGTTPLGFAVTRSSDPVNVAPRVVEWLLDHGANPLLCSDQLGAPVHAAAFDGHDQVLKALLRNRSHANLIFEHFHDEIVNVATPLQCAAYTGSIPCIDILLKYGAPINYSEGYFQMGTALHAAALAGGPAAVEFLLSKGADLSKRTGRYETVLGAAGYGANRQTITLLLNRNAKYDDFINSSPITMNGREWSALGASERQTFIDHIISKAAEKYCTSLMEAARRGVASRVKVFIDRGDNLEQQEKIQMRTPLNWAAFNGHMEVVKVLCDAGARLETHSRMSQTPFEAACAKGHLDVAKYLLAIGASGDLHPKNKWLTPLVAAERSGNQELVKFLKGLDALPVPERRFDWDNQWYRCNPKTYRFERE